ncbi:MAG: hypothetical protein GWP91_21090 [Rhodobacterales bacterium]|nr:hypothetical protein [Rhodobacterales bacterium]
MALWMLAALASAAPEVVIEADYRSHVDQAKFFLKKNWYIDAEAQLSLAVTHPDGRLDPEAWFLLAKVRYELADLPGARDAADHALTQSRDDEQTRQTQELLNFLEQRFGSLQLTSSRAGVSTQIDIALTSVLLDPQLKSYCMQIVKSLMEPVVLPLEIGLPAGSYTINDQVVQVGSGSDQSVPITLSGLGLQTTEITISGGAGTWMGTQATHLLPSPGTEIGVHVPFGTWVVGARAGWWIQPRDTTAGELHWDSGWSMGLTAGIELPDTAPFVIRGAASYRIAPLTGLRGSCDQAGTCGTNDGDGRAVDVHGLGHIPGLEVSTGLIDHSRAQSFGVGMRLVTEYAMARAAASGTGSLPNGESFDYTWTEDRSWQAPGIRVLLDVSFAL